MLPAGAKNKLDYKLSAFRILHTIQHMHSALCIPHFTFRIPHSTFPHFTDTHSLTPDAFSLYKFYVI